jgi:hypothetical protein
MTAGDDRGENDEKEKEKEERKKRGKEKEGSGGRRTKGMGKEEVTGERKKLVGIFGDDIL